MDQEVEDLGLGVETGFVVPVGHYVENVGQDAHVVLGVEHVGDLLVLVDVV